MSIYTMYICLYVCMYVCMYYVCMYVYVQLCKYNMARIDTLLRMPADAIAWLTATGWDDSTASADLTSLKSSTAGDDTVDEDNLKLK